MGNAAPNLASEKHANNFDNISKQIGGTCYAHACAHALRETESRITGRKPLSHAEYVKEIVDKYGSDGGCVEKVLEWQCKKRHLRFKKVTLQNAINAVTNGRVIIGAFYLNEGQWHDLSKFFANKKTRDIGRGYHGGDNGGHAVAIVGQGGDTFSQVTGKPVEYWKSKIHGVIILQMMDIFDFHLICH